MCYYVFFYPQDAFSPAQGTEATVFNQSSTLCLSPAVQGSAAPLCSYAEARGSVAAQTSWLWPNIRCQHGELAGQRLLGLPSRLASA